MPTDYRPFHSYDAPIDPKRCPEGVYDDVSRHVHQCTNRRNNANPEGRCGTHDPAAKAWRAAKRGPTQYERASARADKREARDAARVKAIHALMLALEKWPGIAADALMLDTATFDPDAATRREFATYAYALGLVAIGRDGE